MVDDNADFADVTAKLIRMLSYEVVVRYTGAQGMAAAEGLRPGVILLDLGIPQIDGYELWRRIRRMAWAEKTQIIALTGYSESTTKRHALRAGFDSHVVKTAPLDSLKSAIENAVRVATK